MFQTSGSGYIMERQEITNSTLMGARSTGGSRRSNSVPPRASSRTIESTMKAASPVEPEAPVERIRDIKCVEAPSPVSHALWVLPFLDPM